MVRLTNLAGAAHVEVLEGIHRWEAGLQEHQPMGKEDPIKEDRLLVLPDDQAVSTH